MDAKVALLANEGGHGLGHVRPLNAIALELRNRGWRTVFAPFRISSVDRAAYAFDDIIPAPGWPRFQQERWFDSGSETDILINSYAAIGADFGLADVRVVTNIMQAWESLMNLISPSAVIGDFAPGAMTAANGRCPTIGVGNAFAVPAIVDGWFVPFQERLGTDFPLQDRIKTTIREAKKRAGQQPPADPLVAVRGELPFPSSFQSFDIARGRRIEAVLPPDIPHFEDRPSRPPSGIGAYFGPDIGTHANLLPLLGTLRPRPVIALEGADINIRKAASRAGLMPRDTLFSAQDIARGCRAFLHHGGVGISQLCAVIGVPQLIIFGDTEKWMCAEAVREHGAGIAIPLNAADKTNIESAFKALLSEARFKKAAMTWSEALKQERSTLPAAVKICDAICAAA